MAKKNLKAQRAARASQKRITQGGMLTSPGQRQPDIVLQMPEVFFFDMAAYMASVKSAQGIDYSNRVRLYDMYESALLDLHLSGCWQNACGGSRVFRLSSSATANRMR